MSTHQERITAMTTGHPAHPWHGGNGRCHWTGRQIDDPLAGRPGTGNPLRGGLADEQTVARTAHVLFAGRCIPDRSGLHAPWTLDNMLVPLVRDIDHALTHPARHHRHRLVVEVRRHLVRSGCRSSMLWRMDSGLLFIVDGRKGSRRDECGLFAEIRGEWRGHT